MSASLQEAAVGSVVLRKTQKAPPNETPVIKKKIMVTQKKINGTSTCHKNNSVLTDRYLEGYSPYPRRMEFSFPKSSPNFPG